MKLYYQTLPKEEKNKIKEKFLKSSESIIYKKANKVVIVSIIGILIAVISIVFDFWYKTDLINYILDGFLFLFSLIFLVIFYKTKIKQINIYAINKKNK